MPRPAGLPSLDDLNARLAWFGKRIVRVYCRGIVRFALAPEFALVWPRLTDAWADLSQLRSFRPCP